MKHPFLLPPSGFSYFFLVPLGYYKIKVHLQEHEKNNVAASQEIHYF